ncbi:hypothetical protein FAZ78_02890 [Cereibacter changlensis]|uniref:Uncharacterized protein n=1 Tax=Cereibacter changlensis TaxID=402884 RepID=A0A4U0Z1D6_9RHOB|nr:hypothetical protein [Cereibacter changlensis]TKA98018.1 hypothetical protein FAZ78_02890 [Cereibacter changlensis]
MDLAINCRMIIEKSVIVRAAALNDPAPDSPSPCGAPPPQLGHQGHWATIGGISTSLDAVQTGFSMCSGRSRSIREIEVHRAQSAVAQNGHP